MVSSNHKMTNSLNWKWTRPIPKDAKIHQAYVDYCKIPKISDTQKFAAITIKVEQDGFTLEQCIQTMQRELQTV